MKLLLFQEEAVQRMVSILRERGGVYNACEMGLGKTAMALSAINLLPDVFTTLIICPAIVRLVWKDEIKKWGKSGDYTVLSYNEATSKCSILKAYDGLIADESHYLKNPRAHRTKAVLNSIWPKAKYKICLSGTPFTQSVLDCWTIFSRLAPEDFADYWRFAHTYTNVRRTPWGDKFEGVKNADKLKKIIRSKFFIRYKKKDVLPELPPKIWQKIPLGEEYKVELTAEEGIAQEKYIKLLQESYIKNIPLRATPPVPVASALRKQGLKKVKPSYEFCKNLLDEQVPIVVFGWNVEVIEALSDCLKKYNPQVITGNTSHKDREKRIANFQSGKSKLFIGNIAASGVGLTLTVSSTVIFVQLSFSPGEIAQCSDRCHRIGTKYPVNCYYLCVQNSIDEKVVDIVMKKVTTFNKILN